MDEKVTIFEQLQIDELGCIIQPPPYQLVVAPNDQIAREWSKMLGPRYRVIVNKPISQAP